MNNPQSGSCSICNAEAQFVEDFDTGGRTIECKQCGSYRITRVAHENLKTGAFNSARKALTIATKKASNTGREILLTIETIPSIASSVKFPRNPMEAADMVLEYLVSHTTEFGHRLPIQQETDYPFFNLRSAGELPIILTHMENRGWIERENANPPRFRVQPSGYERFEELQRGGLNSKQAFVAMSFHPRLRPAYDEGFAPAILQAGFSPLRIDDIHYNERIDDKIVVELRRSAFAIVDVTDFRTSVFFEAGFAAGLNLPVIWTCHADDFEKLGEHFDTRQYSYIKWETPDELRQSLKIRILSLILRSFRESSSVIILQTAIGCLQV